MKTKRAFLSMAAAVLAFSGAQILSAGTLFYSGDFDPTNANANGLSNEVDSTITTGAATYTPFIVSGSSWTVTGLFTDNLMSLSPAPTSADWEIRSGVSEGNGGIVVASGSGTPTITDTGISGFGMEDYEVEITGLNIILGPGEYWLSVVPDAPDSSGRSFNANTFGLNSIGIGDLNNAYFNSVFFGANFTNANNEGVFPAFSAGVEGSTAAAPEPGTFLLLGAGLLFGGVLRRKLS